MPARSSPSEEDEMNDNGVRCGIQNGTDQVADAEFGAQPVPQV
jgi:hypothetical protein